MTSLATHGVDSPPTEGDPRASKIIAALGGRSIVLVGIMGSGTSGR